MKKAIILLALFAIAAFANVESNHKTKKAFHDFVTKYNRNYSGHEEYAVRYNNFLMNLEKIEKMNKNQKTATYGINKFSDFSEEELKNLKMQAASPEELSVSCLAPNVSQAETISRRPTDVPTAFDWRSKNVVTPVKNQGQCGSCWTFSTTGNIESQYAINGNPLTGFSEQMIVDCSHACSPYDGEAVCNQGCNGGWMWSAMTDVINWGGLETEAAYPYTAEDTTCTYTNTTPKSQLYAPVKNYTCIGTDENQILLNLLSRGPLSIAMNADILESYTSGIIDPSAWWDDDDGCDPQTLDHALLITGYGVGDGYFEDTPFWSIKNSWGEDWGEQGYFRIIRGVGACGLNNAVVCSALEDSKLITKN